MSETILLKEPKLVIEESVITVLSLSSPMFVLYIKGVGVSGFIFVCK